MLSFELMARCASLDPDLYYLLIRLLIQMPRPPLYRPIALLGCEENCVQDLMQFCRYQL